MFKACTNTQSTRTHTIHLNTPRILKQGLLGQDGESSAAPSPFCDMEEAEVRQWVEANPGRVNGLDGHGFTPLYAAVCWENLPLVLWLLNEKGADAN